MNALTKPTHVDKHLANGTIDECKGRLALAAYDGIKTDDIKEIVENLVKRAKNDNAAAKIVLGMFATPSKHPKSKKKRVYNRHPGVPEPSRRIEAIPGTEEETISPVDKRLEEQPVVSRVDTVIRYLGKKCTHAQVLNHLKEEGLTCTVKEFETAMQKIWPPVDWK